MLSEKITSYYESLITVDDRKDPLAKMVRFASDETEINAGELDDPIGDSLYACAANGKLIHRYPDRVLLLLTKKCPAHCRFCFRKRKAEDSETEISAREMEDVIAYISNNVGIREVILSGGDPLSLPNHKLSAIIKALRAQTPIRTVRIHTRYPVYAPSRCDDFSTVATLVDTFVVHVNHSREITTEFCKAVATLRIAPFLLGQSVLLKDVNDSVDEMCVLLEGLASAGILPYYLHYPDLAPGLSHFRVHLEDAINLMSSLQARLPGYLIPKLILDIPRGQGKTLLSANPCRRLPDGGYILKSPLSGEIIEYHEIVK